MTTEVKVIRELDRDAGKNEACLVQRGQGYYVVSTMVTGSTLETLAFYADTDGNITNHHEVTGARGMTRAEVVAALSAGAGMAEPSDAGCYVDSHWGRYAVAHMVARATEFGFHDAELEDIADRHLASIGPSDAPGITDDEHEALLDASDSVEQWLNDHAARAGYSFGWNDGEFYLWSEAQWQEDSY